MLDPVGTQIVGFLTHRLIFRFHFDRLQVDKIYLEDGAIVTKKCLPYTKEDLTPVCLFYLFIYFFCLKYFIVSNFK